MGSFFEQIAKEIYDNVKLIKPSFPELKRLAKRNAHVTEHGSFAFYSRVKSRSADQTEIIFEPTREHKKLLREVRDTVEGRPFVQVDRGMCKKPENRINCRFLVTKPFLRTAYAWYEQLFEPIEGKKPKFITIMIPEWEERKILVDPHAGITFVLNSDYTGEVKKSFLRQAMYLKKQGGGLGLHAGLKSLKVYNNDRELVNKTFLFFGLSGTGKTTLTTWAYKDLEENENYAILNDDVLLWNPDGSVLGTERNFYAKTKDVTSETYPALYKALTRKDAILENVKIKKDGKIDFLDYAISYNGRGTINRRSIPHTPDRIDAPKADALIYLTRRYDILPPVAKLTKKQSATFFMLGESIYTPAAVGKRSPKVGKTRHCVGTNPFIMGSKGEEGNRILEMLEKAPHTESYLLNTGRVGRDKERGFEGKKIDAQTSAKIIEEIARERIEWKRDPEWGYYIPTRVPGIDIKDLLPCKYYSENEWKKRNEALRQDRIEWLQKFPKLRKELLEVIKE
ncbi:MAG: phosphoenolpyruvate carboxykinase [Candidatus Korarchaeota archaeon]|nr:phosphoenolpyruvate carboxykinase [Candidatus Korarchaeota archaeon]NIU82065.1 phosphoenolpyruvate carboxykinase [Candidatus Thorarchaeota archaeon]NIW12485.1 phosphoenolpyruvate carboxykinase [Candidatus Thorarchaeota archaeon]NIW50699.1 phosphoenolpyruvate carboxykinase [Candidatus Korarchaeota archaeon]